MKKGLYKKSNSFLEMRGGGDSSRVRDRLTELLKSFQSRPNKDYFSQIVFQACQEALKPTPAAERSRFSLHPHVIEEIKQVSDPDLPRYLFYRYRYDIFPQEQKLDDFPPCLQIEPSSICNYRCVFCYQTSAEFTRPQNGFMGTMSFDLFKKIIDEAQGRCEAITLASRGEPLMCRDIDKMLMYTRGKFLALKLNTNAWFLDEKKSHLLLESGVNTVVFSADAASEPLYSQLRVNGNLERVLKNIRQFQEIRRKHYSQANLITRVSGVRYSDNQSMDDMEGLWGDLVDQVAFVDYNPWENVYDAAPSNVDAACSDLWRRLFVWFNGTVNPCDVDFKSSLSVGNGKDSTISFLWTGEAYRRLRESHQLKQRSQCFPCNRCHVV